MREFESTPLTFEGRSGRRAGLTWSQTWIWQLISSLAPHNDHVYLFRQIKLDRAAEHDPEAVRQVVTRAIEDYEALRTTFGVVADGEPYQVVHAAGRIPQRLYEADSAEPQDIDAACDAVRSGMRDRPIRDDRPVSVAIVLADGRPRVLFIQVSHLIADDWAMGILESRLREDLAAEPAPPPAAAPDPWHPADQADYELSPGAARRAARALELWRRTLERFPDTLFPASGTYERDTPRFCEYRMKSPAAAAAAELLARRHQVSAPIVLMAAVLTGLCEISVHGRAGVYTLISNRTTPRLRGMMGPAVQYAPVYVEAADKPFGAVVRETWQAMFDAQRHSQYRLAELDALVDETVARRSGKLTLSCTINLFNDLVRTPAAAWEPPDAGEIRGLMEATTLTREAGLEHENLQLYLAARISPSGASLFARADTTALPAAELRSLLRRIESLLVDAVSSAA